MAKKTKEPRRPKRTTNTQVFIRTTVDVVSALEKYADQEDRSLSKAAERLLIEVLVARGFLDRVPPVPAVLPVNEERVRGGADADSVT